MKTKSGVKLKAIPVSPNSDYMAGEDGQIYSRTSYAGFGRKDYVDWYPLIGRDAGKGYLIVSLCHQNKKVTKSVHRLVCMAFHGMPNPVTLQVRHLDGSKANNRPENLLWGTQSEQWEDARAHETAHEGERHHASKFSNLERQHIWWAIRKGLCSQRLAARVLGVSPSSLSGMLNSKWGKNCG